MIRHLISHYKEASGDIKVVSWIQIDFFKWYWIFNQKEVSIKSVLKKYSN